MSGDICVGPRGGCPSCYRQPCICHETDAERESREAREARQRKRQKAQPTVVELLKCDACEQYGVVADDVRREYICLKCGAPQVGYSAQREQQKRTGEAPPR